MEGRSNTRRIAATMQTGNLAKVASSMHTAGLEYVNAWRMWNIVVSDGLDPVAIITEVWNSSNT
jgi:hypothetical protein